MNKTDLENFLQNKGPKTKIRNLGWLLPEEIKIARMAVEDVTKLTPADQLILWNKSRSFGGAEAVFQDFKLLSEREPEKLRKAICEITKEYNKGIEELNKTHRVSLQTIWNIYREHGTIIRSQSIIPENLRKKDDLNFALCYMGLAEMSLQREVSTDIFDDAKGKELAKKLVLVEQDLEFMHYIGRFKFRYPDNSEFSTIWDLRQEEIPKWLYS